MRCIVVNNANLKTDTYCTYCHNRISQNYAREIGSRFIYCNYNCYQLAAETAVVTIGDRTVPANSGTRSS
jgi:hypothetical protein